MKDWNVQGQSHNTDLSDENKVTNLLVAHSYQQSVIGQFTSFICALILFLGLYTPKESNTLLISWFIFFIVVALGRIGLAKTYEHTNKSEAELNTWRTLFILGSLLGGIAWGMTGGVLFQFANPTQQTLIVLILAGVSAGATPLLAAELKAALAFLVPAIFPLIIQLLIKPDQGIYSLFNIALITYFIYLIAISRKTNHLLRKTIGLEFDKVSLENTVSDMHIKYDNLKEQLLKMESHDMLTDLPNRKSFSVILLEAVKRAEAIQKNMLFIYINLDNFRFVNNAYGHEVGDELLKKIVKRLKDNLRDTDIFVRLGGDELGIILENVSDVDRIKAIGIQVCELIAKKFTENDHIINISASVGISCYPVDGIDPETLLKKAESSMQYVKDHGKNNFRSGHTDDGNRSLKMD
ncbi:MAG: GGDEF domain-containing protein [Gammaproteobacteria bacterium]